MKEYKQQCGFQSCDEFLMMSEKTLSAYKLKTDSEAIYGLVKILVIICMLFEE